MHFDMHVCLLEKVLLCSFDSKNILEVEKWAQFDPQNGVQKWHPKGWPNILLVKKKILQEIKALFKILGLPFGCHFWTPFWGSNSGTIFGSIFQPPFWGPKMVQILQKFLLSKLHSKTFSSK